MDLECKQVIVYGAGGHAKVVLVTVQSLAGYRTVGLLDDDTTKHDTKFYGFQVLGGREQLAHLKSQGVTHAVVAVGDNFRRAELARTLEKNGFQLLRVVHPTATLLPGCRVGDGTVVLVNAFIGGDAVVGNNAIVSVQVVVGHDSRVGSFTQLCPGVKLGGQVEIGDFSFLGMGAVVLPGVRVGRQVVVGANAVVNQDLPDAVTAVGVPARILV